MTDFSPNEVVFAVGTLQGNRVPIKATFVKEIPTDLQEDGRNCLIATSGIIMPYRAKHLFKTREDAAKFATKKGK